jgi:hypothetical protein
MKEAIDRDCLSVDLHGESIHPLSTVIRGVPSSAALHKEQISYHLCPLLCKRGSRESYCTQEVSLGRNELTKPLPLSIQGMVGRNDCDNASRCK